jgi:hypothetical protein
MALCLSRLATPLEGQDSPFAGRLDPATQAAVLLLIDSARARELPTEPLVAKALEGSAKGASGDRIVGAVRALAADLGSARRALGASATPADVVAASAVLRAGVSPTLLHDLHSARGTQSVAVPLAVLIGLIGRGVPVDTAAAVVLDLAQRHVPDTEYASLERHVVQNIRAGAAPGAAVGTRTPVAVPSPPVTPPAGPPRSAPPAGTNRPIRRP